MNAMIFAAGLGTRLRPMTDHMPKALVSIGGTPMLERVAARLASAGAGSIVVNAHHFPEQIVSYVLEQGGFGSKTTVCIEKDLLETGGGLLNARPFLEGGGPFVLHNCDILSNLDLRAFASALSSDALAVLAASRRESPRKLLFDSQMRLCGWTDLRTGEVRSPFGQIDPSSYEALNFAGIHCLSDKVFAAMDALGFSGRFPIIDFYLAAAALYPIYGYYPEDLRIFDIGKIGSIAEAEKLLGEGFCY